MFNPVSIVKGDSPIVLAQPHSGVFVPDDILDNLNEEGRKLMDTDWHIPRLYEGLFKGLAPDLTIVAANFSRYVIDVNRSPEDASLYHSQNTTELVPLSTFDGRPIWHASPSSDEVQRRLKLYHHAYHAALQAELTRIKKKHGVAVLYDCHSIRSGIPYLFEGLLPELNLGTNSGKSCAPQLQSCVESVCTQSGKFSFVSNARFKGGWTTRHYGRPEVGIHAIQMEIAQRTYLKSETPPFDYDPERAETLRGVLRDILLEITNTLETSQLTENRL